MRRTYANGGRLRVIQIRGCNASGKTTCVNGFIKANGLELQDYVIDGKNVMMTTNKDHSIIVLGRYDKKIGGCDLFGSTKIVVKAITTAIKEYKPKLIIFEGMIYSKSMKFAETLQSLLRGFGYKYSSVYLYRTLGNTIDLLDKRSGGGYSKENLVATYKNCFGVYRKLALARYDIKKVDVDEMSYEQTENILQEYLDG